MPWNSADKHADITLSNGDRTAVSVSSANNWRGVRSTTSKASDKFYFEVKVDARGTNGNGIIIGVGDSGATLSYPGATANSHGAASGNFYYTVGGGGSFSGPGGGYTVNDIMGVALDFAAGTIKWYKNNSLYITWTGTLGVAYFPMAGLFNGGSNDQVTISTTTAQFTYSPPSGYDAWDQSDAVIAVVVGGLSLGGQAPFVQEEVFQFPATGSLEFVGQAPQVQATAAFHPGEGSLALEGQAPEISRLISVPAGSLSLEGLAAAPTPQPAVGGLLLVGEVPALSQGVLLVGQEGALVLAGETPALLQNENPSPVEGGLILTGETPTYMIQAGVTRYSMLLMF